MLYRRPYFAEQKRMVTRVISVGNVGKSIGYPSVVNLGCAANAEIRPMRYLQKGL
jgi:hypothetical protein